MATILSLSSRVVRGMVGNALAGFVLQRLGHTVWEVPTVLWDRHPGLGKPTGIVLTGEHLRGLLTDFRAPGQAAATGMVLSGYFAGADQIEAVHDHLLALRAQGRAPLFFCDPICGDAPGLYVSPGVLAGLRDHLVPLADVITPNRFELGLLTGLPVSTNAEIVTAARTLGSPVTFVSSAFGRKTSDIADMLVTPQGAWICERRLQDRVPHGTGDLLTALLAGLLADGGEPRDALARAAAGVAAAIGATRAGGGRTLAVVEAQDAILAACVGTNVPAVERIADAG